MTLSLSDASLLRSQCYIDGRFVGDGVLPVTNPATGAELAKVPNFGAAETTAAVEAAARAFG
ncbi:succinate-semialdehyde dehydrogenase (NADP(+)), partial [Mycobacterium tuberculosis]|nr:succinate-semialdehyde dehydrogenase (NADP(+)) [Mycobacterium tuberculosis]